MSHTYTKELESLILDILLPSFIREQQSKGNPYPTKLINNSLLTQIRKQRKLPALLRAY